MSDIPLRVASYNIHAGVGRDGRFDPPRLIQVLKQLETDIIGLQEVVSVGPNGFALLDELATRCQMESVAGPTMLRGDALYGNALLTRHPVKKVKRLDLSIDGFEPRGALSVELDVAKPITVVVTHLGLKSKERSAQVEHLLEWLPQPPKPILLLGDLNEWWPWSPTLKKLQERLYEAASPRTFPTHWPLLALDRILASSPHILSTTEVHTSSPARKASDHLPLVATLNPTW